MSAARRAAPQLRGARVQRHPHGHEESRESRRPLARVARPSALIERHFTDPRTGCNFQFGLPELFRHSIYSCLAGYEDTNDAERWNVDPRAHRATRVASDLIPESCTGSGGMSSAERGPRRRRLCSTRSESDHTRRQRAAAAPGVPTMAAVEVLGRLDELASSVDAVTGRRSVHMGNLGSIASGRSLTYPEAPDCDGKHYDSDIPGMSPHAKYLIRMRSRRVA